jgi:hypothetical protein
MAEKLLAAASAVLTVISSVLAVDAAVISKEKDVVASDQAKGIGKFIERMGYCWVYMWVAVRSRRA